MDQDQNSFRHHKGSVTLLRFHFVWIPKYRRKLLVGPVALRLEALLQQKAQELQITILRLAIQPDHLHLFLASDPRVSPSEIARSLKGFTSYQLRLEFPHLRKLPSLWTPSFFCSSAGNVSSATIERYIQNQTGVRP